MIKFESVRFKNVLSFGANWTTIPLNAHRHTLVVGQNGKGKTASLLDTLNFGLFGKPFREDIKKSTFVNTINAKDLVVEVTFTVNNHRYLIERGMKPNIFVIHKDGVAMPETAATRDAQTYLEEQILGFNEGAFRQVIVLGADTFIPFMRLKQNARQALVEDLLGIKVFSVMNGLLKERAALTRERITDVQARKTVVDDKQRLAKAYHAKYQQAQQESIQAQIDQGEIAVADLTRELSELGKATAPLNEVLESITKTSTKIQAFRQGIQSLRLKLGQSQATQTFYRDHSECPTCAQDIDDDVRHEFITEHAAKIDVYTSDITTAEAAMVQVETRMTALQRRLNKLQALQQQASTKSHVLGQTEQSLKILRKQLDAVAMSAPEPDPHTDEELDAIDAELTVLTRERHVQELGLKILKDTGIKTKVISYYLPIINRQVNQYLTAMNFPIQFTLDEHFDEKIMSWHRTDFSHGNFSNGQKKRIDLALLFTWRDIARIKNSAYTNLLVLDEILDSALDVPGTEDLLKILQGVDDHTHVFIMSHKDAMMDKFHHVIEFTEVRGFSQMKVLV